MTTTQLVEVVMGFIDIYNRPKIKLYGYQRMFMRRIIEAILEREYPNKDITGLWSRQSGKSEAISSLSGGLAVFLPALAKSFPDDDRVGTYIEGIWIGIFAPKLKQSMNIYDRVRQRAMRARSQELYSDPDINTTVVANRGEMVQWSNGSFVRAQTASEQSNSEGMTFHLIIIDEAQFVGHYKVAKEIQPMLAATNGAMVKIGTAHISFGGFRNSIMLNLKQEEEGHVELADGTAVPAKRNHFEFPYDKVIDEKRRTYEKEKLEYQNGTSAEPPDKFHLQYEAWVSGELQKLGGNINSDEFSMNFRLIWKDANVGAVDKNAFARAADKEREMNMANFRCRQVAGLDYGKKNDSTVLTIMEIDPKPVAPRAALLRPGDEAPELSNKRIIAWLELQGRWEKQLEDIVNFLMGYRVDTIVADATSMGDPLTERLADLLPSVNVIPFPLSYKSNDQLFKFYLQEMEGGRITYPAGPITQKKPEFEQFRFQHEALVTVWHGAFMTCSAPEGEHDDYCDSAALACWASNYEAQAEVECSVNPMYARSGYMRQTSARADRYR